MSSTIGRQLRACQETVKKGKREREPLIVVHEVTETRGINNGQAKANAVLLNVYCITIQ